MLLVLELSSLHQLIEKATKMDNRKGDQTFLSRILHAMVPPEILVRAAAKGKGQSQDTRPSGMRVTMNIERMAIHGHTVMMVDLVSIIRMTGLAAIRRTRVKDTVRTVGQNDVMSVQGPHVHLHKIQFV